MSSWISRLHLYLYSYFYLRFYLYLFVNSFVFVLRWEEIYHGVTGHSWVSRLGEQGSIWSNRNRYWERALWSISRRNVIRIKEKKLNWYGLNPHLLRCTFHKWFIGMYQFSCEHYYEYYSKGGQYFIVVFCVFFWWRTQYKMSYVDQWELQILTLQLERDRSVIVYLFVPRAANTKCWQTACLVSRQRVPEGGGPVNGFGLCANSG